MRDAQRAGAGQTGENEPFLDVESERSSSSSDRDEKDRAEDLEKATDGSLEGPVPRDERTGTGSSAGDGSSSSHAHTTAKDNDSSSRAAKRAAKAKLARRTTVAWSDLPHKGQLTVLTLARLSEPLVQTSLQSYMFYQLKSFDTSLPDSVIASQAGILHASFTAAQFLTAMMWGRVADSPRFGRKTVLMIGLAGTTVSCLGFGFSTAFWQALLFRSLGGATNGNVGVLRTMISEIVRERRFQSRAFLLLPMTFNIGVIIGPILGGLLSDPAGSYPETFGNVAFFQKFPYATPNILSAFFLFSALLGIWLCLEETHDARRDLPDFGIELRKRIVSAFGRCFSRNPSGGVAYTPLASRDVSTDVDVELSPVSPQSAISTSSPPSPFTSKASPTSRRHHNHPRARYTQRLPFRRIFTRNVTITLLAQSLLAFHVGTFNSLWFVFLSTPVFDPAKPAASPHALPRRLPFFFTGGIGLPPSSVGMAMAILGVFGIVLQLFLYPTVSARLGTVKSWRVFLVWFPVTYFLVPYLSLVPSRSPPPHAKDGPGVWLAIAGVLFCHVVGRTFALPAQTILVNNCTPHPSVLGTLHGLAQSTSSLARTIGPMLCGYLYGLGLKNGVIGAVFWGLSGVALCGLAASFFVREGDGHEIWLEGDVEDDEEEEEEAEVPVAPAADEGEDGVGDGDGVGVGVGDKGDRGGRRV